MALYVESTGSGAPVVLVHGFTQTSRSWDPVVNRLAIYRTFVRVDLPGHGESSGTRVRDIDTAAALLGETCGPAVYAGYSLGGRVCLRLALDRPDLVRALVLISSSPGIEDARERAVRRTADEKLASEILQGGVEAFLDRWLAQPMFDGVPAEFRKDRLRNTAAGLAHALRVMGQGAVEPMWDELVNLEMPVGLIVGERDNKYREIAKHMHALIPSKPRLSLVHGAGHAAHLIAPELTAGYLEQFLVRHFSVTS